MEADAPRQPIDRQGGGADQLGDGAAAGRREDFELKGPILTVAEADAEIAVEFVLRLDVGDAPAIAMDAEIGVQPRHAKSALRSRQATA